MKKQYINFLKFISIIFVICIHLMSKCWNTIGVNTNTFKVLTFIDIILLVCVPIFVMCSGNIFLNRKDSFKKMIFKYALKIYLIFILFNSLYKLADITIYEHGVISIKTIINVLKESLLLKNIYHLWYLKIVIAMYVITPLLKYFLNIKNKYIDHILLLVLLLIVKVSPILITNKIYLQIMGVFGFMLYYYLGYYLDKYNHKSLKYLFIPLFIICYYYTYTKTINSSILINSASTDHMQYQSYNIMFISTFIFILVRSFKDKFEKEKFKKLLSFESVHNFNIYLVHGFVIGFLSYTKIINIYSYNHIYTLFIYAILVFTLSLISSIIYIKLKKILVNTIKKSYT